MRKKLLSSILESGFSAIFFVLLITLILLTAGFIGYKYFASHSQKQTATTQIAQEKPKKIGIIGWVNQVDDWGVEGYKKSMTDLGYIEGKNVTYEYTSANGDVKNPEIIAKKYVTEGVDLIYTITVPPTTGALKATKDAGKNIPIVFIHGDYPVENKMIASYASSGNNATGVAIEQAQLASKRLEFLQGINPKIKTIGVFISDPNATVTPNLAIKELQTAAEKFGMTIKIIKVPTKPGPESTAKLQAVADTIKPGEIDAIVTIPEGTINYKDNPKVLISLGKRLKIPTFFLVVPNAFDGAMLAYNGDLHDMGRQAAEMTDKIFKGTKPSDIPIEYPKKYQFVINLKTASEEGITIPDSILSLADQKIDQ